MIPKRVAGYIQTRVYSVYSDVAVYARRLARLAQRARWAPSKGAFTMGLFSHWEYVIPLLIVAMLVFGAKRLPEIGSAAGQTIKSFQRAMREKDPAEEQQALPAAKDEQAAPRQ